jgi:hypothetical protein
MRGCLVLILLALLASLPGAFAQEYSFSVPEMMLEVTVNPDASVTMDYTITFACNPGAHSIDIVDVGLPHSDYDISNMRASVNGVPLSGIKKSSYIDVGVEVPLGSEAIQPGQSGVFEFSCTMPDLVYQDTTRADYASLRITPTWWDGQYVTGTTKLGIVVYLPKSIRPDEVLYQTEPFTNKMVLRDKTAVAWVMKDTRADREHLVGVSFPKREMERVVRMTFLGLVWKWWNENPQVRFGYAVVCIVFLGLAFFKVTSGTGCSVFGFIVIGLAILWASSPAMEAIALPVFIALWVLARRSAAGRRRKYLPPIASVEAGGIKRGLTVPEAAVVLEMPLGKVLTLLVFGMLKKGLVRQVRADPLTVEPAEGYEGDIAAREATAKAKGTVIHDYEHPFLDEFAKHPRTPIQKLNLKNPMKNLIQKTADRMAGFNLEQTREYYRTIISKAWHEAERLGDLSQRDKFVDDNLLWLLLADDYAPRFHYWHGRGYDYRPSWMPGPSVAAAPAGPAVGGRTTFGDVAASFAGWSENVTGRLASTLDPVSLGVAAKGGINLSGVDKVSMDILDSLASSGGGRGGGGGCACAGCACACACAGGGR